MQGVTVNGYEISSWNDKNTLEFIVMIVAKLSEYNKNTLNFTL